MTNGKDKENDLFEWAQNVMREVEEEFKDVKEEDIPDEVLPTNVSQDPNFDLFLFLKDEDDD